MQNKCISQFKLGEVVQGFFLINDFNCKTSSNNKKYLDMTLVDRTGEINAKLWDCSEEDEIKFTAHMLVKVRGQIVDWQSRIQFKIEKIRPATDEDGLNIADFVPSAPVKPDVMFNSLLSFIQRIEHQDIKKLVMAIVMENRDLLLVYPAAKQNHHAVRSGLLYHTWKMLLVGEKLSDIYPQVNRDLLFAGIILHDIAKIDEMDTCDIGLITDYTVEGQLLGHIVQGIKKIDRAARELGVDEEISLLLQHMLLSHHYEPEFGSPKRPMIPEGELLHYIDMIDARMFDMEKALDSVERSKFSEKIWVLHNRRLYKAGLDAGKKE